MFGEKKIRIGKVIYLTFVESLLVHDVYARLKNFSLRSIKPETDMLS